MTTSTAINQRSPIEPQRVEQTRNKASNTTQATKNEAVIEVDSLNFSIKNNIILKNLSFSVAAGEVYALLGGNGAGKSSTLKTLLGFNKPNKGSVKVVGKEVSKALDFVRGKTAYLPESATLYPHLTARENVEYFLSLADIKKSDEQINAAFNRVALQQDAWDRNMQTYSKGMRQKTAIALAILREAPIFLLDEPTSGLDPVAIDEFNQLVRELALTGATILMVTHDVYGACQVANRIGLLKNGELVGEFNAPENGRINTEQVHAAFGDYKSRGN
ncbi:ABC transporter ATP-binding protein [Pseudoalteromonas fuliginea]|uniref:ABC transporter ATP-binding protein n=1 Tax=Pseudoalteromonas fuliginea TaxID=1872678 RepID=A0ABD3Y902_9GAMM|nr:ATP-binding cassette domain-containing protein [Pseudoalteromonas fuliginea]KDC51148.1 ABC transporter ATP-binding protein [Pseudoalteromonas fuliginea]